jgi:hypothetical protein
MYSIFRWHSTTFSDCRADYTYGFALFLEEGKLHFSWCRYGCVSIRSLEMGRNSFRSKGNCCVVQKYRKYFLIHLLSFFYEEWKIHLCISDSQSCWIMWASTRCWAFIPIKNLISILVIDRHMRPNLYVTVKSECIMF